MDPWIAHWNQANTDTWDAGEPFNLHTHQNYLEWYRSRTRIYLRQSVAVETLQQADTTQLYPSSIMSSHHMAVRYTCFIIFVILITNSVAKLILSILRFAGAIRERGYNGLRHATRTSAYWR